MRTCRTFEDLESMEHGLVFSVGSGKTGKSTLAFSLAEQIVNFAARPKYFYDVMPIDVDRLFPGFKIVRDLWNIPPGSIVFFEDMIRLFASRGSGNKAEFPAWLSLISQNDLVAIISTQDFMDIDVSAFRLQKPITIHSYMFEQDLKHERPEYVLNQAFANIEIERHIRTHPEHDPRSIKHCSDYNETFTVEPPSYWSKAHSQLFRGLKV